MVRGVLNVPVVEDLAAVRLSGFWENRDGYQENFYFSGSDQDADDADDFGIRSQLLWTPHDSLDMTLRFNYARKRGVGYALKRDGPLPEFVELVPFLGRAVDLRRSHTQSRQRAARLLGYKGRHRQRDDQRQRQHPVASAGRSPSSVRRSCAFWAHSPTSTTTASTIRITPTCARGPAAHGCRAMVDGRRVGG